MTEDSNNINEFEQALQESLSARELKPGDVIEGTIVAIHGDVALVDSACYEVRILPFPRLWTHLRLGWELEWHPPDVLFVPAHVMPLVCRVPAVVTVHDLGYVHYPEAHRPLDRRYLDWTTRRHARLAAAIIADSQSTRGDLVDLYRADPKRISVIYPGRDESFGR